MGIRIAVLSDIHANHEALKELKPLLGDVDLSVCLGDFIGYYCQVNEVLDCIREFKTISIRGNHDEFLLSGYPSGVTEAVRFGIDYADGVIDSDHRRWLESLPLLWGGLLDRRSVLLAHGSPFQPLDDYLYADVIPDKGLERFDFDLLAFGQTHRPLTVQSTRALLLNPGSVGQSRHKPRVACAAIIETGSMTIQFIEQPYDTTAVIAAAKRKGAGAWIEKHLI